MMGEGSSTHARHGASRVTACHPAILCRPKTCKDAISLGLELYADKQFKKAIAMWQKSLELPGSGAMRMSGTVREFRCAAALT